MSHPDKAKRDEQKRIFQEFNDTQHFLSYSDRSLTTTEPEERWDNRISHAEFLQKLITLVDGPQVAAKHVEALAFVPEIKLLTERDKEEMAALRPNLKPVQDYRLQPNNIRSGDSSNTKIASMPAEEPAIATINRPALAKHFPFKAIAASAALFLVLSSITLGAYLDSFSLEKTASAAAFQKQGDYQSALSASSLAVKCNPFCAGAYYVRGQALVSLLRYSEAQECFNSALSLAPSNKDMLDARAALSLKIDRPQQTIRDSKKLIALSKGALKPYQYGNLAAAYYKKGLLDEAFHYYNMAVNADPKNVDLQIGLAYCLASKKQLGDALKLCSSLIAQFPGNAEALALRGYCLQSRHDFSGASKDLDLAVRTSPGFARAYAYRAALSMQMGESAKATSDVCKVADLEGENAEAQCAAANMLLSNNRKREAVHYFERLSQLPAFRKMPAQVAQKAALDFELGNYAKTIKDCKLAVLLKPSVQSYELLAQSYAYLGQAKEARECLAELANLENGGSILLQARVEQLLGNSVTAIDKYSQVLAVNPDSKEALVGRGDLYRAREQWASAAQDYRHAVALGVSSSQVKTNLSVCLSTMDKLSRITLDLPRNNEIDLQALSTENIRDRACACYKSQQMASAAIYFAELVKRQPENVQARRYLAHSQAQAGYHDQAVSSFASLSRVSKLDTVDQIACAKAHAAAGRYEQGIDMMLDAQRKGGSNLSVTLALAQMLSASGKIDQAISLCKSSSATQSPELRNLYQSLLTQKQRGKEENKEQGAVSTEG